MILRLAGECRASSYSTKPSRGPVIQDYWKVCCLCLKAAIDYGLSPIPLCLARIAPPTISEAPSIFCTNNRHPAWFLVFQKLEYVIDSHEGDCRSMSWQKFVVQVRLNNGCRVETTWCWMPSFFLARTTSFVDLWNVEIKIGHSRLNLISFDFIGFTTWHILKIGLFFYVQILCLNSKIWLTKKKITNQL